MFWLTIRQHRMQLVATAGTIVAIGVGLLVHAVVTSTAMAGRSGVALDQLLDDRVGEVYRLLTWLPGAPALIGLFWGAPVLTREVERGTQVLVWTQSVTRQHWIATKLAVLAAAVTVSGLALGAMVTAWQRTFAGSPYAARFNEPGIFTSTGVAIGAWWLFAFTLGTAAGALTRKMLPAMVITLAVFVVALVGVLAVRDNYATPAVLVRETPDQPVPADSIVLDGTWGVPGGTGGVGDPCADAGPVDYQACAENAGYREILYYQPGERYWRFQWTEAGILGAAALLLGGVTYRRVSRRAI
jgi:hypothetical protein